MAIRARYKPEPNAAASQNTKTTSLCFNADTHSTWPSPRAAGATVTKHGVRLRIVGVQGTVQATVVRPRPSRARYDRLDANSNQPWRPSIVALGAGAGVAGH